MHPVTDAWGFCKFNDAALGEPKGQKEENKTPHSRDPVALGVARYGVIGKRFVGITSDRVVLRVPQRGSTEAPSILFLLYLQRVPPSKAKRFVLPSLSGVGCHRAPSLFLPATVSTLVVVLMRLRITPRATHHSAQPTHSRRYPRDSLSLSLQQTQCPACPRPCALPTIVCGLETAQCSVWCPPSTIRGYPARPATDRENSRDSPAAIGKGT